MDALGVGTAEDIRVAIELEEISTMGTSEQQATELLSRGYTTHSRVDAELVRRIGLLQAEVAKRVGPIPLRTSGYRSVTYQAHFRDIQTTLAAIDNDSALRSQCAARRTEIDLHRARHGLGYRIGGLNSLHVSRAAMDLDSVAMAPLTPLQPEPLDSIARQVGLRRPVRPIENDPVHFVKTSAPPAESLTVRMDSNASPRLLVTDPSGRRVGQDPATGASVNELGEDAIITSPLPGRFEISFRNPEAGIYSVEGRAMAHSTYYELSTIRQDESGDESLSQRSGSLIAGESIAPLTVSYTPLTPVTAIGLEVLLNQMTFAPGESMVVRATLSPLPVPSAVDAYIVVQLPTGHFMSLQLDGRLVPGIVPIARNFVPFDFVGQLVQYRFIGSEPRGQYNWFSALTEPGTLTPISTLLQTTFVVR